jgi:hypothetical protein
MFRKLVSNLSFSPALVGQMGFYAKRLRKEEATRRIGLIFTALALIMQSFAVFSPPEAANAANPDAVIYNSLRDKQDLLNTYDRNNDGAGHTDLQQIYAKFGITRNDIVNAHEGFFNTGDFDGKLNFVGRTNTGAASRYPVSVDGTNSTVYTGAWLDVRMTLRVVIGQRAVDGQWFAIMLFCGNPVYVTIPPVPPKPEAVCSALTVAPLTRTNFRFTAQAKASNGATISSYDYMIKNSSNQVIHQQTATSAAETSSIDYTLPRDGSYTATVAVNTSVGVQTSTNCAKPFTVSPEARCALNSSLVVSDVNCKPCPSDSSLWYKDQRCVAAFDLSKSVRNVTQSIANANDTTSKPSDHLEYTLTVKNTGKNTGSYTMKDDFSDIAEYADVTDLGGGTLVKSTLAADANTTVITWPTAELAPGETISKIVSVQIKSSIPAMATNETARHSYDCKLTNVFGNTVTVGVQCPPEKAVEQVVTQLPHTGPTENILFAGVVASVVVYFYARARQIKKEVRLIRRDLNAGTI